MSAASFFEARSDTLFISTELTRGPWSRDHQHGGPPAALIARGLERRLAELGHDSQVARITVEFVRPVPIAPLALAVEVVRAGRKVQTLTATLTAGGDVVARAAALAIRRAALSLPAHPLPAAPAIPPPAAARAFDFPFFPAPVGYHTAMEARFARGELGKGPVQVWMRMRVPLVPDETPSPLCRVLCAADSGNGVSPVLDWRTWTFVNPDITVYLHRAPAGEWIAMDAATTPQPTGVGLAESLLLDEQGPIGRALQCLVLDRR